ncbi:hypothetical protein HZA87_02830 [Candidatus Uhrbacteria bacterium]|nr:hypothetical protein [Candidatus Uhrbacteria bacterium]
MTPRSPSLPAPKTLEDSAKYYAQLFAECFQDTQDLMRLYMAKREEIRKKNPIWIAGTMEEKFDRVDARVGIFTKQVNNLITTGFHHVLYNKSLCDINWLKANIHANYSSHLSVMEKQFDNCFKFVAQQCFQSMFHLMESSFRVFIKHLHPNGIILATGKFQPIYSALFKRLNIKDRQERIKLMEFMSAIRNTMHNNWYYMPPSSKPKERALIFKIGPFSLFWNKSKLIEQAEMKEFDYKGKSYKLIPNESINFITWKMIMAFAKDLLEIFDEIVSHKDVISIPEIIEERFPSDE